MRLVKELTDKFEPFNCKHKNELSIRQFSYDSFPHCDLGIEDNKLLKCAWLLLIYRYDNQFHVLMTIRSFKIKTYPGEVCFPGGKFDPELDKSSFVETALRESNEEIGLNRENVRVLCKLCPFISPVGHYIVPIIGLITNENTKDKFCSDIEIRQIIDSLKANVNEVESIFSIPFSYFLNENYLKTRVNLIDANVNLDPSLEQLDLVKSKYLRFVINLEDKLFEKNKTKPFHSILYGINASVLLFVVKTIYRDEFNLNQIFNDYIENFNMDIFDYLKQLRFKGYLMYKDYLIKKSKKAKL